MKCAPPRACKCGYSIEKGLHFPPDGYILVLDTGKIWYKRNAHFPVVWAEIRPTKPVRGKASLTNTDKEEIVCIP